MIKYKPQKQIIKSYKQCVIAFLMQKYGFDKRKAKQALRDYEFDELLVSCNYMTLHDDPEMIADEVYEHYQVSKIIERRK